jgi:virulence-associated protein VapD
MSNALAQSIENIRNEINNFVFQLLIQGLSYINTNTLKTVDQLLQAVSQAKLFRVSVSLRYLKSEFERYIKNSQDFDIDRLIFFISQVYLLTNGIHKMLAQNDPNLKNNLQKYMGSETTIIPTSQLDVRLVGIQAISIQGSMTGYSFHFLILSGKFESVIFTFDYLKAANSLQNTEFMFTMKFNDLNFILNDLFNQNLSLNNCGIDPLKRKIYMNQKTTINVISTPIHPIMEYRTSLLLHELKDLNQLLAHFESIEIVPFETPIDSIKHFVIKEPTITSYWKSEDVKMKSIIHFFEMDTPLGLKFKIKIDDKMTNKPYIANMQNLMKSNLPINYMLGYLFFNENAIEFIPLFAIFNNQDFFVQISHNNPPIS